MSWLQSEGKHAGIEQVFFVVKSALALYFILKAPVPIALRVNRGGIVGKMQSGQSGIKRDRRHAGDHFRLAIDGVVLVGCPVVIAEGNQGPDFQAALRASGSTIAKLILHNRGVFAVHHEHSFLQLNAVDLIRKYGKRIEAETLKILISLRMDRFGILITGKLNAVFSENQRLFQLREQCGAARRRSGSSNEQAMVTAGIQASDGGRGKASQAVALKPFAAVGLGEIRADAVIELNHWRIE